MLENTTLFLIIIMISAIPYSLVTPLLPTLSKEENLIETLLGFIISLFPLAVILFSIVVPILCKNIPVSSYYLLWLFFEAIMTILYGTLIYIPIKSC